MTPNKKKAAAGFGTRAASKDSSGRNHSIRPRIKAAIVALACGGLLPAGVTDWIVRRGGMRDA